jgi:tetratricopeptide (TPR) repeat protein
MTLDLLIRGVIYIFFFTFPIFFLPLTPDSYEYNKMALLVVTCAVLLILLGVKNARQKKFAVIKSSFDIPLFFLAGISAISAFFQSPNWVVSFTTPLSTTTIVAATVFYFILTQLEIDNLKEKLMYIISLSAFFVSLYTVFLYSNILPKSTFTPAGSLMATTMFLAVVAIYLFSFLLSLVISSDKRKKWLNTDFIIAAVATFIIAGTTVLLLLHLFTDQKPLFLPFSFGWIIFVEILKNSKTLFLGIGPANFITAFTLAKPVNFNLTPYWNIIFTSSSSFLLTVATETGIIAAISYMIILIKSFKFLTREKDADHLSPFRFAATLTLTAALLMQAIFPSGMAVFILTVILLVFVSKREMAATVDLSRLSRLSYYFLIPQFILLAIFLYFAGRTYVAEAFFKKSLDAFVNNKGDVTYKWQKEALALNPYLDRYHLAFSQTNLALANSLAGKKEPTDEDKQNIPTLIKQSIDEGRAAVALFRTSVINWDNLAGTYASITNFAEGAQDFAAQSYQQKIALDPNNPNGYINYGGLLMSLKKVEEAQANFQRAAMLKPDLPNAHYNLAIALKEQKKYKEAYDELKTVSSLIPPEGEDAKKLAPEIEALSKLVPPQDSTPSATVATTPAPTTATTVLPTGGSPTKKP